MTSSILYWENENSGEIRVEKSIDQGVPEETEVQTMHFIEKIDRQVSFCVIEEDGYLVIYDYETQEKYDETPIHVNDLPERLREQLKMGLYFSDEKALYEFLDNYSS